MAAKTCWIYTRNDDKNRD